MDSFARCCSSKFVVTPQSLPLNTGKSKRLSNGVLNLLDGPIIDERLWTPADNFAVEEIRAYENGSEPAGHSTVVSGIFSPERDAPARFPVWKNHPKLADSGKLLRRPNRKHEIRSTTL